jgi:hypothetical protein
MNAEHAEYSAALAESAGIFSNIFAEGAVFT